VSLTPEKASKQMIGIIKSASLRQTIYGWVIIALVVGLAFADQWRWAWLVLGCAALRALIDGTMGIVSAISGVMFQVACIDERMKR
jgi:hypothetical protein